MTRHQRPPEKIVFFHANVCDGSIKRLQLGFQTFATEGANVMVQTRFPVLKK